MPFLIFHQRQKRTNSSFFFVCVGGGGRMNAEKLNEHQLLLLCCRCCHRLAVAAITTWHLCCSLAVAAAAPRPLPRHLPAAWRCCCPYCPQPQPLLTKICFHELLHCHLRLMCFWFGGSDEGIWGIGLLERERSRFFTEWKAKIGRVGQQEDQHWLRA